MTRFLLPALALLFAGTAQAQTVDVGLNASVEAFPASDSDVWGRGRLVPSVTAKVGYLAGAAHLEEAWFAARGEVSVERDLRLAAEFELSNDTVAVTYGLAYRRSALLDGPLAERGDGSGAGLRLLVEFPLVDVWIEGYPVRVGPEEHRPALVYYGLDAFKKRDWLFRLDAEVQDGDDAAIQAALGRAVGPVDVALVAGTFFPPVGDPVRHVGLRFVAGR